MAKAGVVLQWNKEYEGDANDCLCPLVVHAGKLSVKRKLEG